MARRSGQHRRDLKTGGLPGGRESAYQKPDRDSECSLPPGLTPHPLAIGWSLLPA